MLPDFNRLKIFYYIYINRSIASAAKDLHLTQSGISQHLKKLEEELGVGLFIRLHKQLVPTIEANRLFEVIQPFLENLKNELQVLNQSKAAPYGHLKIGAPAGFGQSFFPGIFAGFRQLYPDVTFSLILNDSIQLLDFLREGKVDFALVDEHFLAKSAIEQDAAVFREDRILNEEVILAVSKKYADTVLKNDFSYDNLIRNDFISYQSSRGVLKRWFKHHFNKRPGHLKAVMTVNNVQAVISGVTHHMGMGVIPSHMIYKEIRKRKIIPVITGKAENINCMSLVQLQDKEPTYTEKTFHKFFKAEIKKSKSIFSLAI